MKYRIEYVLYIELEADGKLEAYVRAARCIPAFDLTSDIDAVIGCGDVGDAHAWVQEPPVTIKAFVDTEPDVNNP